MLTRQLTPEESAALDQKYGKPTGKIGSVKRNPAYPTYPKLNLETYQKMKANGMTDKEICKEVHISTYKLADFKREWLIIGVVKQNRKKPREKCKLCDELSIAKGLCRSHYMKMRRWNHVN